MEARITRMSNPGSFPVFQGMLEVVREEPYVFENKEGTCARIPRPGALQGPSPSLDVGLSVQRSPEDTQ